jgi:RNA polymerase sigma-70 factor (ECF subfamily)
LNTISANIWKNRIRELRSLKRDVPVISLDTGLSEPDNIHAKTDPKHPLDKTILDQQRQLLRKAVAQLPETVYACVVLRVYHELSYREIATILQIHHKTVKSRIHQAQNSLKLTLGDHMHIDLLAGEPS